MASPHMVAHLRERAARQPERVAQRHRTAAGWQDTTWASLDADVRAAAAALIELGVGEQRMVGIFSANRPEWTVADLGTLSARAVPVPIYPTNTVEQAAYIVRDADIEVLFVAGSEPLEKARQIVAGGRTLTLVSFDEPTPSPGVHREMPFSRLLELGRSSGRAAEVGARLERVTPDDMLTLIYTSGTTGEPKGVMLTQANLTACREIHDLRLDELSEDDTSLCFLPLSHVFERCWTYYVLHRGMVNHYLDDPTRVVEALQEVRPTVVCVVPRFLEKVHSAIEARAAMASPLRRRLLRWAVATGRQAMLRTTAGLPVPTLLRLRHRLADRLVLEKLRGILGGRIRLMPCAGAPLAREVEEFFYAIGIRVAHGYGLTETCATVSFHDRHRVHFGTVGPPMPRVEVRIGADDEIQVRAPTVMKGYYRKPEATAEAFVDGWFRTGDAGAVDDAGCLVITDRIKDLIKTSGGKYIAPQAIEATLGTDPLIEQAAVVGDVRKYVTALIVPAFPLLEETARQRGIPFTTPADLVARPEVLALFQERVDTVNRNLARFEQVKRFTLLPRPFSVEAGELTPTLKIRRKVVAERHRELVDRMYAEE
jgi:long-chain acyl-CoA synthetase